MFHINGNNLRSPTKFHLGFRTAQGFLKRLGGHVPGKATCQKRPRGQEDNVLRKAECPGRPSEIGDPFSFPKQTQHPACHLFTALGKSHFICVCWGGDKTGGKSAVCDKAFILFFFLLLWCLLSRECLLDSLFPYEEMCEEGN